MSIAWFFPIAKSVHRTKKCAYFLPAFSFYTRDHTTCSVHAKINKSIDFTESLEIYIKLKVEFFLNRYVKIPFKYLDALHRFWTIQKKIEWNSKLVTYAICFGRCCCHFFFRSLFVCLPRYYIHFVVFIVITQKKNNMYYYGVINRIQIQTFRNKQRIAACMQYIYYVLWLQKSSGNVVHFGRLVGYRFITVNLFFSIFLPLSLPLPFLLARIMNFKSLWNGVLFFALTIL